VILIVAYDLHNPGRSYGPIAKLLKTATGGWAHPQGSVWLIDTTSTPTWWRDNLDDVADANDEFFVMRVYKNWAASASFDDDVVDWLKSSSRNW